MENSEPKHLSPWIAWSLIIGAFGVCLFCTWYYFFSVNNAYEEASVTVTPVATSTKPETTSKSISESTIADWQKYTSPSYGYSVEFPKIWTWNGEDPKIVTMDSPENAKLIKERQESTSGPMHDIYVYYYPTVADEAENVQNNLGATTLEELVTKNTALSSVNDTMLGGINAKEAVWGGLGAYYSVFAVNNNHLYIIQFGNAASKADLSAVESQILSTFKFN